MAASAKDKKKEPPNGGSRPSPRKVSGDSSTVVNPVLAGILQRSHAVPASSSTSAVATGAVPSVQETSEPENSYKAVAKSAVGRGIRHRFSGQGSLPALRVARTHVPAAVTSQGKPLQKPSQDSLSQLATNYRNSLNDMVDDGTAFDADPTPLSQLRVDGSSSSSFFGQDSSLLELAMIPEVDEGESGRSSDVFNFVDFPNPEVRPKSSD